MKHDNYYIELEKQGYYESVDKRSKDYREYKEWKKAKAIIKKDFEALKKNVDAIPKGLGDVVAKVTKTTGIDKVVKFIAGEDCGCEERRDKWNKIPMFKRQTPNCIKEEDYNYLVRLFSTLKGKISSYDYDKVLPIYNYVFKTNKQSTSCDTCAAKVVVKLKKYLETYK
jgi:hypothetical protein